MPDPVFVTAVNRNGVKQRIPREWLNSNSPFARDFRLPPSAQRSTPATNAGSRPTAPVEPPMPPAEAEETTQKAATKGAARPRRKAADKE